MTKDNAKNQVLIDAAVTASEQLTSEKVPHCLVGRLAMSSHGYDAGIVEDVMFLIDASAAFVLDSKTEMVVTKVALPVAVGDVKIKWCSFENDWEADAWSKELSLPASPGATPIAPLPVALCLMMLSGDDKGVMAALADGAHGDVSHSILAKHAPRLAARLLTMMEAAGR